jgi:hypothetical protein
MMELATNAHHKVLHIPYTEYTRFAKDKTVAENSVRLVPNKC